MQERRANLTQRPVLTKAHLLGSETLRKKEGRVIQPIKNIAKETDRFLLGPFSYGLRSVM